MNLEIDYLNSDAQSIANEDLMRAISRELNVAYQKFGWIWVDKFFWNRYSWNEIDKLGLGKQICQNVVNMIMADAPTIWTPSENINRLIELELFGRMQFNSVLAEQLVNCMINGDMLMTVERDEYDGQLAIDYIDGSNMIPLVYNRHTTHKIAYFSREYIGEETYIILTVEDAHVRYKFLYRYKANSLSIVDFGTNEWTIVMGRTPQVVEFKDVQPYKRFACVSTGKKDGKWKNVPYHNSFLYPLNELEQINKDWEDFCKEYLLGEKALFIDPSCYDDTNHERERQGFYLLENEKRGVGGLYRMLSMGKEMMHDYNPELRFEPWYKKIKADFQMICTSRGLDASIMELELPTKEMTATESIMTNKKTKNTIENIEAKLKPAIQTIVYALINEWLKDGMISKEDFAMIDSIGCIDVKFSDGFFRNREQTVNMYLNIMNSPAPNGGKLIPWENFLREGLGYSKEHAAFAMAQAKEEFAQMQIDAANIQAMQAVILAKAGIGTEQDNSKEKKPAKKEEKK